MRLPSGWAWRVAWRDAKRSLAKLILALSCMTIGTASMVAAISLRARLGASTREQAKTLLGADLEINSREPFSPEAEALIRSIGGDQSREISFSSMALFPAQDGMRLVQVRALAGKFPYYGKLETEPAGARDQLQFGLRALVDENLMLQFGVRPGDTVRIGNQSFRIAGGLRKIPGESLAFSLINPRVYIRLADLDATKLLQRGSLARYRVFFKLAPGIDADKLVQGIAPQLEQLRLRADTVQRRAAAISRALDNLSRYLGLGVFVAVLLAGIGIASGVHVYAKEKTQSAALLRCLGATAPQTLAVYLIQISAMGFAASCIGAAAGVGMENALSFGLRDFLPVAVTSGVTPTAVLTGVVIALGTGLLFALPPLLSIRVISPLRVLRLAYEENRKTMDAYQWVAAACILVAIFGIADRLAQRWIHAAWFTIGVVLTFFVIALIARATLSMVKRLAGKSFSFAWRQALANLHRPNNQTVAVMLAIGLAAFLFATLFNLRSMLLDEVAQRGGKGEPNLVFFDVQAPQRGALGDLVKSFQLPVIEEVPVVTLRLTAVQNRPVRALLEDSKSPIPGWALRREYRVTYRSGLTATEHLIRGEWQSRVASDSPPIAISLEQGIAKALGVDVGDRLDFELQGVPLETRVASIREVDWERLKPNFFVVFPEGVLEQAPQFYVLVTRSDAPAASAKLQRAVAERFPNVSAIDLTLVLDTLDTILERISTGIQLVASFTILTGLLVLAGAILSRRSQRLHDSVLLKLLGASRRQIIVMIAAEYVLLAAIAGAAGIVLSGCASWVLAGYFFTIPFTFSAGGAVAILMITTIITGALGVLGCWGIFRHSGLEALRADT